MLNHLLNSSRDLDECAALRAVALQRRMRQMETRLLDESVRVRGHDLDSLSNQLEERAHAQVMKLKADEEAVLERIAADVSFSRETLQGRVRRISKQATYACELNRQIHEKQMKMSEDTCCHTVGDGPASMKALGAEGDALAQRSRMLDDEQKIYIRTQLNKPSSEMDQMTYFEYPPNIVTNLGCYRKQRLMQCSAYNENRIADKKPDALYEGGTTLPDGVFHTLRTDFRGLNVKEVKDSLIRGNQSIIASKETRLLSLKCEETRFARIAEDREREEIAKSDRLAHVRVCEQKEALERSKEIAEQVTMQERSIDIEEADIDSRYNEDFFARRFGNSLT